MVVCSRILNKLMVKLGFNQYIAQGGDVGSMATKTVVEEYDECIGRFLPHSSVVPRSCQASLVEAVELTLLSVSSWSCQHAHVEPASGRGHRPAYGDRTARPGAWREVLGVRRCLRYAAWHQAIDSRLCDWEQPSGLVGMVSIFYCHPREQSAP